MKIKELIAELQKLDPELMVVVPGYEGGYSEANGLHPIRLDLNVNTEWYYGKHEQNDNGTTDAYLISVN